MIKKHKLEKYFNKAVANIAKPVLITKDPTGIYRLFGKYIIIENNDAYQVECATQRKTLTFSTLKNAMSWCTLDHEGLISESARLCILDTKLCSIEFDIAIHKKLLKTSNTLIRQIKLQEDTYKRRAIIKEINYYINSSKTLQYKKFNKLNK